MKPRQSKTCSSQLNRKWPQELHAWLCSATVFTRVASQHRPRNIYLMVVAVEEPLIYFFWGGVKIPKPVIVMYFHVFQFSKTSQIIYIIYSRKSRSVTFYP